jgi:hypothetical protein
MFAQTLMFQELKYAVINTIVVTHQHDTAGKA